MAAAIQVLHRVHGLHRDYSGSAPSAPTLTSGTSNDAAGFASCCGPSSCSPKRAFDTGLRPGPIPTRAASLLPGLLTATRTGLTPASDDEHEPTDHPVTRSPPVPLGARKIEAKLPATRNGTAAADPEANQSVRPGDNRSRRHATRAPDRLNSAERPDVASRQADRQPVWLRVGAGKISIPGPPASMASHVTDVMRGSIGADTTAQPTTPRLAVGSATEPKHRR